LSSGDWFDLYVDAAHVSENDPGLRVTVRIEDLMQIYFVWQEEEFVVRPS